MPFSGTYRRPAVLLAAVIASLLLALMPPLPAQAATLSFVNDAPPETVVAGAAFRYQFTTTSDTVTYTLAKLPGDTHVPDYPLPPGLTMSPDGVLSGAPSESGTFYYRVEARSGTDVAVSADHILAVDPTPPVHFVPLYGDHQSAVASGTTPGSQVFFVAPLVARLVDAHGYPARDQYVTYAVTSGSVSFGGCGGSRSGQQTGVGGYVQSEALCAGTTPGSATVDLKAEGVNGAIFTFHETVRPPVTPSADLAVTLRAPAKARTQHRIDVVIQVDDLGPTSADDVHTTLTWPKGWSLSGTGASPGTVSGRTLTLVGDPVDSDIPLTYTVSLLTGKTTGPARLRARTSSATADPVSGNNSASTSVKLKH